MCCRHIARRHHAQFECDGWACPTHTWRTVSARPPVQAAPTATAAPVQTQQRGSSLARHHYQRVSYRCSLASTRQEPSAAFSVPRWECAASRHLHRCGFTAWSPRQIFRRRVPGRRARRRSTGQRAGEREVGAESAAAGAAARHVGRRFSCARGRREAKGASDTCETARGARLFCIRA